MLLTAQRFETGLLAHNFFPRVARRGDELPPCFISSTFTTSVASKLNSLSIKRLDGYGSINVRTTRYNFVPRNLEIVHPRAFAAIARQLKASWKDWKSVMTNESSAIRVTPHADGRVFSMVSHVDAESLVTPGGRFRAKVDITNFYGSIYTHSFPWAVHGLHAAKMKQEDKNDWANQLDFKLRQARRRETTGIAIGPGTSGVAGEILLGFVDERLRNHDDKFEFLRFIDDYYFIAPSRDMAERFINAVRIELAELKLSIHPGKTSITELPTPISPSWMRNLRKALHGSVTKMKLLDALDHAIEVADVTPEDDILKYVLVSVEEALRADTVADSVRLAVIDRLLNVGYLRPAAVGSACRLLVELDGNLVSERAQSLNEILKEHAQSFRTDAVTWILYTLLAHNLAPSDEAAEAVVDSGDCLAMALLALDRNGTTLVRKFMDKLEFEVPPDYRRDEYWLLYYQYALDGDPIASVPDEYYDELRPLLEAEVSFIDITAKHPYRPYHDDKQGSPQARNWSIGRVPYA